MQPRLSSAQGRRSSLGVLVLLLLFLSIGNATWFQLGGRPLHWDSAIHLSESLNANRVGEDTIRPYWKQFLYVSWYYPPFVSYASIPFYRLFGESEFTGSLIMSFFLVLLVASVYGIALQFFDQDVAIISAFLISMCSIVIEFSRDFMLDLPLASMVALSMFLLYASREFKNTFVSTLFGISLGLGFLTKWTFIFFLAIPLLCVFLQTIKRTPERFVHIRNLLLSILVGTAISAPWYLVHILQILMGRLGELGRGERSIFHDIIYYLEVIPGQVSWLLNIVLVAGIVLYLKYHRKPHLGLLAWFIGSYAIISVLSFKQPRFSIPLLPPLVIAASAGIVGWRNHSAAKPKHRSLVVQSVLTVVLVQYFLITFIPRMSGIGRTLNQPLLSASLVPVRGPSDAKWQQDEILRAVEEQIKKSPKLRAILRVIPDHSYFNRQTFEYFSELHRLPIVVSGSTSLPLFTDYVVVKTGDLGEDAAHRQVLSEHVIENSHQSNPLFTEIKRFPLPDGSEALLFRATPQRADDVSDVLILKKFERLAGKFIKKYVRPVGEYSLHAAAYDSAETVRGHVKSLRIRAKQVELGDFAFEQVGVLSRDLDLKLFDIVFDPASLIQRDSLQILSLAGLHINGLSIEANGLQDYVEASSKGKTIVERLSMNDGILQLEVHQLKPNLTIDARVRLWNVDHRNLSFAFEETQISSIPIHPAIINILTDSFNPLLTGFGYLSDFRVGHLTLSNGELRIQSEKED